MFKLRLFAASVLAFGVGLASAQAQQATLPPGGRIVTIGDSLSDNGNLLGLTGNPPAPYYQGRFSNGPVWTELISGGSMNQPYLTGNVSGNVNLAFGGARTDNATNLLGPIPSLQHQLGTFMALGGTFGAADTVTLLGGANNIFQYFQSAGGGITEAGIVATSVGAAGDMTGLTNAIAGAGAGRILVANLPDIGVSPDFSGNPAAAAAATAATNIFNAALASGLTAAAAANPDTNIIQMDLASANRVIMQNAAAFGITNTTQACITVATCVAGTTATQNTFLFWDGVHPTARGHQLIALYALLLLNPEAAVADAAVLSATAVRGRLAATDDISDRAIGWSQGQYERRNGPWISLTGSRALMDARGDMAAYNYTIGGLRAGIDQAVTPNLLIGASFGASTGALGGTVRSDLTAVDGDVYATYTSGAFFATAMAGASRMSFDDIRRNTGFGPVDATGSTSATQLSAGLEAGMFFKAGTWTLTPSARVHMIRASIDGYNETAPILAMAFAGREIDAVFGGVKLRASTPAAVFGANGRAFGEIGYESLLSGGRDTVIARFVGNTAHPFGSSGDITGRGVNLKVGYDARLSDKLSMTLSYGAALNDGDGTTHTGQARFKLDF